MQISKRRKAEQLPDTSIRFSVWFQDTAVSAQKGKIAVCRGKRALYCICIAMIHVHSRGVAHRDLKSANVLITQDGTMRLADMGQAWLVGSEDLHTRTGTEGWRSPEQRRGEVLTLKTDVFSLGVVFCEVMLS